MNRAMIFLLLSIVPLAAPAARCEDGPNRRDEPLAEQVSLENALGFLDRAVIRWQERRNCVTCHTNGLYLVTRSRVSPHASEATEARQFARDYLEQYIVDGKKPKGQRGSVEGIVATTSYLTIGEMAATGKLEPLTRKALDHVFSLQDEEGAWNAWLKCHWGPFEVDDHFGATLVAVAMGAAPADYRKTAVARRGLSRLAKYLARHPPVSAHQKGMMLWAARGLPALAPRGQRKRWIRELLSLQHDDGGWNLVELGDAEWQREDDSPQDESSDGYATAFMLYTLRQAGVSVDHPQLEKAVSWLTTHQRVSGRWFTASSRRDGKHYITHAATNMAVLALAECAIAAEQADDR